MDSPVAETMELGVAAYAGAEAARSTIPAFRKQLNQEYSLPPSLLKYAEEQTVVSLAAVLNAIRDFGLKERTFSDWGVVSGPRFLGREYLARHLEKCRLQGALGASPLITAYLSLHAVSGTISLALQIHGPNLGVGGSRGSMSEALLTGLAMQKQQNLPGVWVTVSEWDPEPIPDDSSQRPEPVCRAVALALAPPAAARQGFKMHLIPHAAQPDHQSIPAPTVADLAQFFANGLAENRSRSWACALPGNGLLELTKSTLTEFQACSPRAA